MLAVNRVLAIVFLVLGVAILVRTASLGGGQVGIFAGLLFVVLGVVRLRATG